MFNDKELASLQKAFRQLSEQHQSLYALVRKIDMQTTLRYCPVCKRDTLQDIYNWTYNFDGRCHICGTCLKMIQQVVVNQ